MITKVQYEILKPATPFNTVQRVQKMHACMRFVKHYAGNISNKENSSLTVYSCLLLAAVTLFCRPIWRFKYQVKVCWIAVSNKECLYKEPR